MQGFGAFRPAPAPPTSLGTYRLLSPSAAVRVSPLCFGGLSLGNQWTGFLAGKGTDKDQAFALLDTFYEAGGNFVDTANNYQGGCRLLPPFTCLLRLAGGGSECGCLAFARFAHTRRNVRVHHRRVDGGAREPRPDRPGDQVHSAVSPPAGRECSRRNG